MRTFHGLWLPLMVHLAGYALVMFLSTGKGSFVGLGAISAMVLSVPAMLLIGWFGARGKEPLWRTTIITWPIALIPPGLLLVLHRIVS